MAEVAVLKGSGRPATVSVSQLVSPFTWRRARRGAALLDHGQLELLVACGPARSWRSALDRTVVGVLAEAAGHSRWRTRIVRSGYHLGRVVLGTASTSGEVSDVGQQQLEKLSCVLDASGTLAELGGSVLDTVGRQVGMWAGAWSHPSRGDAAISGVVLYEWSVAVAILETELHTRVH